MLEQLQYENATPLIHSLLPNSEQQRIFLDACEKEQLFGGAKRGGKTVAGVMKIVLLAVLFPGNRILMARYALSDLKESTLVTFLKTCPPHLIKEHKITDKKFIIRTTDPRVDSEIIYRGLGDEADLEKAKGLEIGALWIDEPTEVPESIYNMLFAQLCWVLPDGSRPPYMSILTSNPEPGWVKRLKEEIEKGERKNAVFIPALPRNNPDLPPGWELELRDKMDLDWVAKYLDGSWTVGTGSVFTELNPLIHDISDYCEKHPNFHLRMNKVGGSDYGTTGVTTYIQAAIDDDENIFFIDEVYEANKTIDQTAAMIKSMAYRYGNRDKNGETFFGQEYMVIDPSTEAKTQQGPHELHSVLDEFQWAGVPFIPAYRQLIQVGIDRMKQLMHVNPKHVHPFTKKLGSPRFFVCKKHCPNLWQEMEELRREILATGVARFLGKDHAVDPARYIISSRPQAGEHQQLDELRLPLQEQFMNRAHDRWASTWGKAKEVGWFS